MLLFTPGPTEVPPSVLRAMSKPILNPDIDFEFFSLYEKMCGKIRKIADTRSDVFVMAGEGMVALDSAVCNLVERGDEVLSISSGVFGDGFADFVSRYGGKPIVVRAGYDDIVSSPDIERALETNPNVKVATFVHCETPSGTISPLVEIGKICRDHDVILIADTVSTLGGMPINADRNHIEVCLGASQKCFSSPPGLALITVGKRAWEKIESRKSKVSSFYLDLLEWKNWWLGKRVFPYTQSVSDIFALDVALDLILKEGLGEVYRRHKKVADLVRNECEKIGIEFYPEREEICSDTVTALKVPRGIDEKDLRNRMKRKYRVEIAGSWGKLEGKVIRLGHMGFNAQEKKARLAVSALSKSLHDLGFSK
jgi:aspartate aminotransferase-like enzyme